MFLLRGLSNRAGHYTFEENVKNEDQQCSVPVFQCIIVNLFMIVSHFPAKPHN